MREKEEETEEMVEKLLEMEAEERLKAMRETGTAVTRENFERWAKAFDAERALGKWTTETNTNNDKIDDATTAPNAAAAAAAAYDDARATRRGVHVREKILRGK